MTKTQHYELKKPEITDPLRVADFNENSDLIDAALAANAKALSDYKTANDAVVAKKAAQSAVTALEQSTNTALANLTTALGSGGKTCRVTYGSYVGTREYGKDNPNTLTFDFYPILIWVGSSSHGDYTGSPTIMLRGQEEANAENAYVMTVTWSDNGVSWYGSDTGNNQNNIGTFFYVAIGYDLAAQE